MPEQVAVVSHNVTAMRSEPAGGEQVSQGIFGETVRLLGQQGEWSHIVTPDGYQGWVLSAHLAPLTEGSTYPDPPAAGTVAGLFAPVQSAPSGDSERVTLLTLGTLVELLEEDEESPYRPLRLPQGGIAYARADQVQEGGHAEPDELRTTLVRTAIRFVGVPYLWGGRTPFGIDCSGFVQRVYALCGHIIPRDAYLQARWDRLMSVDRGDLEAGDLVFFQGDADPRGRGITHVGMAVGDGRFVHASGGPGVAIGSLDDAPYKRWFRQAGRLAAL